MPRKIRTPAVPPVNPHPHEIKADAVYWLNTACASLELTRKCLARETRLGRLRSGKRAGRVYYLGEWLLEWLRNGERVRSSAPVMNSVTGSA